MDLEILKIAENTDHNKNIENYTHFSKLKNSLCGDEIQIKLIIKKKKIIDFAYQEKSCVYCQASASLLSKSSINKKVEQIDKLCDDVKKFFINNEKGKDNKLILFRKLFNKKNYSRKECILLPFNTLKKIVSS